MPTLITAIEFRERFDISGEIRNTRITPHIGAASRRLRRWVGETVYAEALAATEGDLREDLQNAEAHLAYHFAVLGLNTPLTTKGIVATATAGEGKVITRYLSPSESAETARNYLELAREIAEPYMLSDGTPGSSYEIAREEDDA